MSEQAHPEQKNCTESRSTITEAVTPATYIIAYISDGTRMIG